MGSHPVELRHGQVAQQLAVAAIGELGHGQATD